MENIFVSRFERQEREAWKQTEGRTGQRGSWGTVQGTDMADLSRQGGSERCLFSYCNL